MTTCSHAYYTALTRAPLNGCALYAQMPPPDKLSIEEATKAKTKIMKLLSSGSTSTEKSDKPHVWKIRRNELSLREYLNKGKTSRISLKFNGTEVCTGYSENAIDSALNSITADVEDESDKSEEIEPTTQGVSTPVPSGIPPVVVSVQSNKDGDSDAEEDVQVVIQAASAIDDQTKQKEWGRYILDVLAPLFYADESFVLHTFQLRSKVLTAQRKTAEAGSNMHITIHENVDDPSATKFDNKNCSLETVFLLLNQIFEIVLPSYPKPPQLTASASPSAKKLRKRPISTPPTVKELALVEQLNQLIESYTTQMNPGDDEATDWWNDEFNKRSSAGGLTPREIALQLDKEYADKLKELQSKWESRKSEVVSTRDDLVRAVEMANKALKTHHDGATGEGSLSTADAP